MFEEEQEFKVFKITFSEVLKKLSSIKNCNIENLKDIVTEQFDNYNYEGEEELKGIDTWCDISDNGKYELSVGINHEDAYIFTLYVSVEDNKVNIYNVL